MAEVNVKVKYKIESTYLQFPIFIETESNDEAFEMFVAYCDYQQVDEDEIECKYDEEENIIYAEAKQNGEDEEDDESVTKFTFERVKEITLKIKGE